MAESKSKQKWQPDKRDMVFFAIVAAVILLLVLGANERKTKPVPDNETHQSVQSRAECMTCHSIDGVKPQPIKHTKADQCFQCHLQPEHWNTATP
ncbi:MAG: cytochrome c3 family protein [Mariprofundaceae bacterium]|nr:cytochrome c3 family protein [Mariprofundaceae bacterium]